MPISSFRAWVGFAKANPATFTTAAVAAAAVSVPVSGVVVPAASTIYIIDGALSEVRAVTAGGGSGTLTVAALTNAHAAGVPVYWQLTASIGPADYVPVTSFPDGSDNIATVADTGIRGSNVSSYGVSQVSGSSEINLAGDVIPDSFGWLLGSIFGAVDFTGGTPNSHIFAGMNTAASNGQPTELMCWVYNGANTRLYVGVKAADVTISWDPLMLVKWTAKLQGFMSAVVANPTPSFTAIGPQAAWQCTVSVGSQVINLMTASISTKRAAMDIVQTIDGNQSPYKIWAGPLGVTGTLTFVMEDDTQLLNYLNNSQPAVSIALTNGTGATQVGLTYRMTKCNYTASWKNADKNGYVETSGPFEAVANTTDANTAGAGYSPARVTLLNAHVTGYQ